MKKITTIITTLFTLEIAALCSINVYDNILVLSEKKNSMNTSVIKSSTCPEKTNLYFLDFIRQSNGKLNTDNLKEFDEFKMTSFSPKVININNVKSLIQKQLPLSSTATWFTSTNSYGSQMIGYQTDETINLICNTCNTTGKKSIKALVKKDNQIRKVYWIKGNIKNAHSTYVARQDLPAQVKLNPSKNIIKKTVFLENSGEYSIDPRHLKYFKLRRPIKKNSPIKKIDLTPIKLIRTGHTVTAVHQSNSLNLSLKAVALRSGGIDDIIKLRNPKTKKIILGKIIDRNKVEIEL